MGQVTGTPPDVPGALHSTAVARIAELEAENTRLKAQLATAADNFRNTWTALGQANKECDRLRDRLEGRQRV